MAAARALPHFERLFDAFEYQCEQRPQRTALTWLHDDGSVAARRSYEDIAREARGVAARIQAEGLAGQPVLLLYAPGLEFASAVLGALASGAIAVPIIPPVGIRPQAEIERMSAIIDSTGASVILTTVALKGMVDMASEALGMGGLTSRLRWICTDDARQVDPTAWRRPDIDGGSPGLIQFTSGSTQEARGVTIPHRCLVANARLLYELGRLQPDEDVLCSWLPPYHDLGLIGGILTPLYGGFEAVLLSPLAFLRSPLVWLQAIETHRVTISGGPNFAFDAAVRKTTPAQRQALNLSRWRIAMIGAERIRSSTVTRFAEAFAPCGFRRQNFVPGYGLAEATLFVTGGTVEHEPMTLTISAAALERHRVEFVDADAPDAARVVGCGSWRPHAGQEVRVVDPDSGRPLAAGHVGEIWFRGPTCAAGYWRNPEETARVFGGRLAGEDEVTYLRTGDLGFVHHSELFVTGRLKELIIVDGRNLYPQDLERVVERDAPGVRAGGVAAFAVDVDERERAVIVAETEVAGEVERAALVTQVRKALARAHSVDVFDVALVERRALPKTTSGKIQRAATRRAYLDGALERLDRSAEAPAVVAAKPPAADGRYQAAPSQPPAAPPPAVGATIMDEVIALGADARPRLEAWLIEEFRAYTAKRYDADMAAQIAVDVSLTDLGMTSLDGIEIATLLDEAFPGVPIPVEELFHGPTLAKLAELLLVAVREAASAASPRAPQLSLITLRDAPRPAARVVCFPHAGGLAVDFEPLARGLQASAQVLALELPRGSAQLELVTAARACAAQLAADPRGAPLVLLGHSFGSVVAWEVAVALERLGVSPALVVVSAAPPPQDVHGLTVKILEAPLDPAASAEFRTMADRAASSRLFAVKDDLALLKRYSWTKATLSCPMLLASGADDGLVPAATMTGWAERTTGPCERASFPGGHDYPYAGAALSQRLRARIEELS
ncbi:MAG: AMP-binding protein [Nannocystaceae bacterium]